MSQHFSQQQNKAGSRIREAARCRSRAAAEGQSRACSCCCGGSEDSGQGSALHGLCLDRRQCAAAQLRRPLLRCGERDARGCGMPPGGMRPGLPMQPQIIFADQLFWSKLHLTIGNSALSAAAFCAALSQVGDRPVDHRSCLPAYQQWQQVVRPLEDPDWLAAHLQNIGTARYTPVHCLPFSCLAIAQL